VLIPSERHTTEDLRCWAELQESDLFRARDESFARHVRSASQSITDFLATGDAYCSVSWGKDSVVCADMVLLACPSVPLVWVRVEPICNPDCAAVRDAFLKLHPGTVYHEIAEHCTRDEAGWHATGTLERGVARAADVCGTTRHYSGVRADESGLRTLSAKVHGIATEVSCRPLLRWDVGMIFAYLAHHDLPVHPAYAMLGGGRWPRDRIRVSSLGGRRGEEFGRTQREQEYYGDHLRRLSVR
jgi:phosphoadenosine phosphosulfate reductase